MQDEISDASSTTDQSTNPAPSTKIPDAKSVMDSVATDNIASSNERRIQSQEGTQDILPDYQEKQQYVDENEPYGQYYSDDYDYNSPAIKTLLSWKGNGRPFHNHGKEYYINASLIAMISEVLLFLFSQYVLMLVIISMLFVVFALAVVPPHTVNYRISTEGIAIDDYFYLWQELYDFYFKHINGEDILHIRTKDEYASDITVLLGDIPKDYIKALLIKYLPYREIVPLSFMEKSGNWLSRTFPLDKVSSTSK